MSRTIVVHIEVPAQHIEDLIGYEGLPYTEEAIVMAVAHVLEVPADFTQFNASVRGELNEDGTLSPIA
jgi:hypothetical protein